MLEASGITPQQLSALMIPKFMQKQRYGPRGQSPSERLLVQHPARRGTQKLATACASSSKFGMVCSRWKTFKTIFTRS